MRISVLWRTERNEITQIEMAFLEDENMQFVSFSFKWIGDLIAFRLAVYKTEIYCISTGD